MDLPIYQLHINLSFKISKIALSYNFNNAFLGLSFYLLGENKQQNDTPEINTDINYCENIHDFYCFNQQSLTFLYNTVSDIVRNNYI